MQGGRSYNSLTFTKVRRYNTVYGNEVNIWFRLKNSVMLWIWRRWVPTSTRCIVLTRGLKLLRDQVVLKRTRSPGALIGVSACSRGGVSAGALNSLRGLCERAWRRAVLENATVIKSTPTSRKQYQWIWRLWAVNLLTRCELIEKLGVDRQWTYSVCIITDTDWW